MNDTNTIASQMRDFIVLFKPHCSDTETFAELLELLEDKDWGKAHALFSKIREKTLKAEKSAHQGGWQYHFEEICAKTLYNLSDSPAPFDPDSPYWVVPFAFAFAKELKIDASKIISIIQR